MIEKGKLKKLIVIVILIALSLIVVISNQISNEEEYFDYSPVQNYYV